MVKKKAKKTKNVVWIPELSYSVTENLEMFENQASIRSQAARNTLEDIKELVNKFRSSVTDDSTVDYVFWRVMKMYCDFNYVRKSILECLIFNFVPKQLYVYQLFSGDNLVYVGKSKTLASRLDQHRRDGKVFDNIKLYSCKDEREQDVVENTCILKLDPPLNSLVNLRLVDHSFDLSAFKTVKQTSPDFVEHSQSGLKYDLDEGYHYIQCLGFVHTRRVGIPYWKTE